MVYELKTIYSYSYGAGLFETASESCIHGVYHVVIYDDNKNDINELKRLISDIKREKAPYIYTVDGKIVERNTEQTIEYLKSMEEYKKIMYLKHYYNFYVILFAMRLLMNLRGSIDE